MRERNERHEHDEQVEPDIEEAITRPPAFLFWASNWISSTALMTAEQRGWYIQLLAWSWWVSDIQGTLPDDDECLKQIAGYKQDRCEGKTAACERRKSHWQQVKSKFKSSAYSGYLENKKLMGVRRDAEKRRKRRTLAAKKAAQSRWNRES